MDQVSISSTSEEVRDCPGWDFGNTLGGGVSISSTSEEVRDGGVCGDGWAEFSVAFPLVPLPKKYVTIPG